ERIAGLLVPEQRIARQRARVSDRRVQIEASVGIDREVPARTEYLQKHLDARAVLGERRAADLHLDHGVPALEIALHLAAQGVLIFARVVVPARRLDEHARIRGPVAITLGQHLIEWLAAYLRDRVPYGHVDRPDRDGALAVAT